MPHKSKLIIGCISILAIIIVGLFFLNKELPGCFSPNFFSKIKTDAGCFELETQENDNIKSAAIDYFKRINYTLKIKDAKISIYKSPVQTNGLDVFIILKSESLDQNPIDSNTYFYEKHYGVMSGQYNFATENETNFKFNGFIPKNPPNNLN
jgi:hypothetical protein